jgi:protein-tyrosine phosphatase
MRKIPDLPLWLGNANGARNFAQLFESEIAAIVDLAMEEQPQAPPRELIWLRYPLVDGAGNAPSRLRAAVAAIVQLVQEGVPTLVACSAGMSRAPAIAAAAVASLRDQSPDDCLGKIVAGQPHDVSPQLWGDIKQACFSRD